MKTPLKTPRIEQEVASPKKIALMTSQRRCLVFTSS